MASATGRTFRPADVALATLLLPWVQTNDYADAAIAQIERVGVPLAAVTDNGDCLAFEPAQIAVFFVVSFCHVL